MCGRFRVRGKFVDGLPADQFHDTRIELKLWDRFNVSPGQSAPLWWRDPGGRLQLSEQPWRQPPLYNARCETVAQLRSYRTPFRAQRCLIPMNGFYEWDEKAKPKQPWHFHLADDSTYMVAALWTLCDSVPAFTLITTEANATVAPVHHRMPVIVPTSQWQTWLDVGTDEASLKSIMRPFDAMAMEGWPVSPRVNNWRNDDEHIIDRYQPPRDPQLALF